MENKETHNNDIPLYPALPVEKFGDIKPATLAKSIVIVVVVIMAINIIAMLYLANETFNLGQTIVKEKWDWLYHIEQPGDYVLLGDSSGNQGFNPAFVDKELGLYGLNLATIGHFGYKDDHWLLETYIKLYGAPKTVIIVHTFDVGQRNVSIVDLMGTYPIPFEVVKRQAEISKVSVVSWLIQVYQMRFFPLFYRRDTLGIAPLQYAFNGFSLIRNDHQFNKYGFMSKTQYDDKIDRDYKQFNQQLLSGKLDGQFALDNRIAIKMMINLAEEHDFMLYFVNSPNYIGLQNDELFEAVIQGRRESYETLLDNNPHAMYIPDIYWYPAEEMENLDHLRLTSVEDYTRRIMESIWGNLDG